jgi:hypothetical protein
MEKSCFETVRNLLEKAAYKIRYAKCQPKHLGRTGSAAILGGAKGKNSQQWELNK